MSKMHLSDVMCLINQFLFEVSSTCWVISRWAVRQMLEVSDTALDTLVKSQCKNDPGKWSYFENSSTVASLVCRCHMVDILLSNAMTFRHFKCIQKCPNTVCGHCNIR